jgi:hypothetical protein
MCSAENVQRTKKNATPVVAHSFDECSRSDEGKNHRQHKWYNINARPSSGMVSSSLEIDRKIVCGDLKKEVDTNKGITNRRQETCWKRQRMLRKMRPIFVGINSSIIIQSWKIANNPLCLSFEKDQWHHGLITNMIFPSNKK